MRRGGNRTIKNLLHRNLEIEIFRMKTADSTFGTDRRIGSMVLDEDADTLYLLLVAGRPFDTITSLLSSSGIVALGGSSYNLDSMTKTVYDNGGNSTGAVEYARNLGVPPGTPGNFPGGGSLSPIEIYAHIHSYADGVNPNDPDVGPHGINQKADLHGDPQHFFRVNNAQSADEAIRLRKWWDIAFDNISPMSNTGGTSINYFWKGFWLIQQTGQYPMVGLTKEQRGWYWIVTNDGSDDNIRQWKTGQYMVYNGNGNGSAASDWDQIDIDTRTGGDKSTGLELVNGNGWMYKDIDRTFKLVIGGQATDQSAIIPGTIGIPRFGASALGAHAKGRNTLASGDSSDSTGKNTKATGEGSHVGGIGKNVNEPLIASGRAAFNHSEGGADVSGDNSAKLAGVGGDVTGDRSVTLGGTNLVNTEDDTIMVPKLNIGGNQYVPEDKTYEPINTEGIMHHKLLVLDTEDVGKKGVVQVIEDNKPWSEPTTASIFAGGIVTRVDTGAGNASTQIKVTAGSAQIVDVWSEAIAGKPQAWEIPQRHYVEWPEKTIDLSTIMRTATTAILSVYIEPDSASGPTAGKISTSFTELDNHERRSYVALAEVLYSNSPAAPPTDIIKVTPTGVYSNNITQTFNDLTQFLPERALIKGIELKPVTTPLSLSVWQSRGSIFAAGINRVNDTKNPNVKDILRVGDASTPLVFKVINSLGQSVTWPPGMPGTGNLDSETVMPFIYENGPVSGSTPTAGVTTELPATKAVIQYIYSDLEGTYYVQLGQSLFDGGGRARASLKDDRGDQIVYSGMNHLTFIGQIYVQKEAVSFDDPELAGIENSAGDFSQGADDVRSFINLDDVPSNYTGHSGERTIVGISETGLKFEKAYTLKETINQPTHGFLLGQPIYYDSVVGIWKKAKADNKNTLMQAVVFDPSANTFEAVYSGILDSTAHGYTSDMYLSATTEGTFTATEPTTSGAIIQLCVKPFSDDKFIVVSNNVDTVPQAEKGEKIQTYTTGDNYLINDLIYYKDAILRVTTAITNAPAKLDYTKAEIISNPGVVFDFDPTSVTGQQNDFLEIHPVNFNETIDFMISVLSFAADDNSQTLSGTLNIAFDKATITVVNNFKTGEASIEKIVCYNSGTAAAPIYNLGAVWAIDKLLEIEVVASSRSNNSSSILNPGAFTPAPPSTITLASIDKLDENEGFFASDGSVGGGGGDSTPIGTIVESTLTEAQFNAATPNSTDWALADGRDVTGSKYAIVTGRTTLPDMRGAYMRMAGTNAAKAGWIGAPLGSYEDDSTRIPRNTAFTTDSQGNHNHDYKVGTGGPVENQNQNPIAWMRGTNTWTTGGLSQRTGSHVFNDSGNHSHTITGGGDRETRPTTYTVNFFVKIDNTNAILTATEVDPVTVAPTAPAPLIIGQMWLNSDTGDFYILTNNPAVPNVDNWQWVQTNT